MIFATYAKDTTYRLTKDKLYIARPEGGDTRIARLDRLEVVDDNATKLWIAPDDGNFTYSTSAYAVVVKHLPGWVRGEVVLVDDIDEDGFLSASGRGFISGKSCQLLDRTLVVPGMVAYFKPALKWVQIDDVNDRLAITAGVYNDRPLTEFIFPVVEGDLAMLPLVRCKNAWGMPYLRDGAIYRVTGLSNQGDLLIVGDDAVEHSVDSEAFEFI